MILIIPLNSGRTAVLGNDLYIGNSSNSPIQVARVDQIPATYVHPSSIQCSAATEINSLKSSVSSGKASIASAITGKGISTSSSASFSTMASNIRNLQTASTSELIQVASAGTSGWGTSIHIDVPSQYRKSMSWLRIGSQGTDNDRDLYAVLFYALYPNLVQIFAYWDGGSSPVEINYNIATGSLDMTMPNRPWYSSVYVLKS